MKPELLTYFSKRIKLRASQQYLTLNKQRACYACGSDTTYIDKKGGPRWYSNKNPNQWLCQKCNNKYFTNPKWSPIWNPIKNPINYRKYGKNRIGFKGRKPSLKFNPRTGICSKCLRSVARGEIKRTAMHHIKYDPENPAAHTVELCGRCHAQTHTWLQSKPGHKFFQKIPEHLRYLEGITPV